MPDFSHIETRRALHRLAWALAIVVAFGTYVFSSPHSPLSDLTLVHHGAYLEIAVPDSMTISATTTGMILVMRTTHTASILGQGAESFVQGSASIESPIVLHPGEQAYITPGQSPTGTSFRNNTCAGYLAQFQEFTPPLPDSCPLPEYFGGDKSCASYIRTLPQCEIVYNDTRISRLSKQCRAFVANEFNYNSCMRTSKIAFGEWRIYAPGIETFEDEPAIDLYDSDRTYIGTFSRRANR